MSMDDNATFERIRQDNADQYVVINRRVNRAVEILESLSKSKSCPLGNGALDRALRILKGVE